VSQARAGFESDRWSLKVCNLEDKSGPICSVDKRLDRPIQSFTWNGNGRSITAVIDDEGTESIIAIPLATTGDGTVIETSDVNRWSAGS